MTLTVRRDGQPVATKLFQPSYKTGRPNGPDCEPVCTQGSAVLAW